MTAPDRSIFYLTNLWLFKYDSIQFFVYVYIHILTHRGGLAYIYGVPLNIRDLKLTITVPARSSTRESAGTVLTTDCDMRLRWIHEWIYITSTDNVIQNSITDLMKCPVNDVMAQERFLHYCTISSLWGELAVDIHHNGSVMRAFDYFLWLVWISFSTVGDLWRIDTHMTSS